MICYDEPSRELLLEPSCTFEMSRALHPIATYVVIYLVRICQKVGISDRFLTDFEICSGCLKSPNVHILTTLSGVTLTVAPLYSFFNHEYRFENVCFTLPLLIGH